MIGTSRPSVKYPRSRVGTRIEYNKKPSRKVTYYKADQNEINICLGCTREKCTGDCSNIRK